MKRYFISMACILAALVSCQKNVAPVQTQQENRPVKVTLTATIGGDATKVSFVDSDNVLKTAWEVGDKVSVLSVNNGYLISNDVFTAKNAGKTAEFEGTFTNHPNTTYVYVYYSALTEGEGTVEKPYMSQPDNGSGYGVLYDFLLYEHDDYNSMYFSILDGYHLQKDNADPSHLSNQMIMMGVAEMDENDLTTKLDYLSYVIKVTMTLPGDGYSVKKMELTSYKSDATNADVTATDWQFFGSIPANHNRDNTLQMSFGDAIENSYGEGTGWTLDGNTLTVYMVGHGEKEIAEGNYWEISVPSYLDGEYYHLVGKKDFPAVKTLEPGKIYRLNIDLEPES